MATYPTAVKSFGTKNAGDTIQPSHVNDLQDEVNAIEDGLLNGSAPLNSSRITAPVISIAGGSTFVGLVTVSAGIAFPAVQAAVVDVNTLDDYEEGNWTPTIVSSGGGTPTYTTQVGSYVKVGKKVDFWGRITLATFGTLAAGTITVSGLPFTAENVTDQFGVLTVTFWANFTTALVNLGGVLNPNAAAVDMRTTGNAGAVTTVSLTKADMSATSGIIFSGTYRATA